MTKRRLACFSLAAALATSAMPAPALADGAASTRNIIIGGAAAALLIINHNRKVHEKYAEKDRAIARQQARAYDAEAAYQSERQAYAHEAALVASYKREVAMQHQEVVRLRHQIAMSRRAPRNVAATQPQPQPAFHPLVAAASYHPDRGATRIANVSNGSYGWGAL
ncbi:MAG TPA: hypothetical protein VGC72_07430 [Candidatus Elarobacter sp.]